MEVRSIEEFLSYFGSVRRRTRAVAECIPPDRIEWAPAEGRFTAGDLVRHIAATERWMWGENVRGRPSRYPGHGTELAEGKQAVLAYLDRMHEETVAILEGLTPDDLNARSPTPGGIELRTWKWLRAMIEHEIHHRGQLYALLGLLGVETPSLYGLTETEVFENSSAAKRLTLLGVPSSAGARRVGQDGAPAAFRAAGLLERLRGGGVDVEDAGDLPRVPYRPDPAHPRCRNRDRVLEVARNVRDRVRDVLEAGRTPLVLGGDCTIALGVLAAFREASPGIGLVYFDGDVDLNTPETSPSGVLEGMVLAHALGLGDPELSAMDGTGALISAERLLLFGYDEDSGWIDPPEMELLRKLDALDYPLAVVRPEPGEAARRAVAELRTRADGFIVHFDVDVTDLASADVEHAGGLDFDAAADALGRFVSDPGCRAIVVTELNVERDPDGGDVEVVTRGLLEALTRTRGGEP
jgi:arginase